MWQVLRINRYLLNHDRGNVHSVLELHVSWPTERLKAVSNGYFHSAPFELPSIPNCRPAHDACSKLLALDNDPERCIKMPQKARTVKTSLHRKFLHGPKHGLHVISQQ